MSKKRYIVVRDAFNNPVTLDTKKVLEPRPKRPKITYDAFVEPPTRQPKAKKN